MLTNWIKAAKAAVTNASAGTVVVVGTVGGVIIGGGVGSYITDSYIAAKAPYIGCDFTNRDEAATLRKYGVLPKDPVYKACKEAVDNFFADPSRPASRNVIIQIPTQSASSLVPTN